MKNKNTNLDDVKLFLEAAKKDLEEQQREFSTLHTDLIKTVDVAQAFLEKHLTDPAKDRRIAVLVKNDEKTAMWENDLPENSDKVYLFDTSLNPYDEGSLGEYTKRRDQYLLRLNDLEKALKIVDKLQKKNSRVKDAVELLPIIRILSRHDTYLVSLLNNNPTPEQIESINHQSEVLNQLLKQIESRESRSIRVKKFFSKVKVKLKKKQT